MQTEAFYVAAFVLHAEQGQTCIQQNTVINCCVVLIRS